MAVLEQALSSDAAAAYTQGDPVWLGRDDLDTVCPNWDADRRLHHGDECTVIERDTKDCKGVSTQRADYLFGSSFGSNDNDLHPFAAPLLQALEQLDVLSCGRERAGDDQIEVLAKCDGEQF